MTTSLILKNREVEGFYLADPSEVPKHEKYFTDSRNKVLLDNTAPYGHFVTSWLYSLLTTLEDPALTPENTTILIYLSSNNPDLALEHMSTVTAFVADKLRRRGYLIEYIETEAFYVSNLYGPLTPPHIQDILLPQIVGRFLAEGVTTSAYGRKIYLSRSKTNTSNSRNISRVDDEAKLESYLQTLGFEILTPEDFDSYQDQLNRISEARILASITSSALHAGLVLQSPSKIVEFVTDMSRTNDYVFHDNYRVMALSKGLTYTAIPNITRKAQDIIDHIEANPDLKLLLAS